MQETNQGIPQELHEIRLMDHGQCSASLSIHDDVLVPIQQELWGTLVSEANAKKADVNNNGYYSIAYLDHATNQPLDARGGFFVEFAFTVVPPWPIANRYVEGRYSYEFGLDGDGTLVLGWRRYYWKTSCSGVGCGKTDDAGASFTSGMENDLPGKFHDTVLARQHVPIRVPSVSANSCELPSDCVSVGSSADLLAAVLNQKYAAAGLSKEDASILASTVHQTKVWACEPSADPLDAGKNKVCQIKLAAKRLSVFPDEVDLVWFDGKDLQSAAYAMHVASLGTADHDKLCSGGPPTPLPNSSGSPSVSVMRHFAAHNF